MLCIIQLLLTLTAGLYSFSEKWARNAVKLFRVLQFLSSFDYRSNTCGRKSNLSIDFEIKEILLQSLFQFSPVE